MKPKSKAFLELIQLHSKNPKRTKELLLTDRRMTNDERNVIRGFLLMRDNQNLKAFSLASSIKTQQDPEVESMRLYLLGATLNNQGKYQKALNEFQKCHQLFPKNHDHHLEFVILNNLFVIYMNLHKIAEAKEILSMMKMISNLPETDLMRLKRLEFGFYTSIENQEESLKILKQLIDVRAKFTDHDFGAFQIQVFNFGIEKHEYCDQALNEIKDQKKYSLTQNYNYMKILFQHLKDQTAIYIHEPDFQDYPTLLAELKFIKALDQHKESELSVIWKQLHSINPQSFKEGFKYEGFTNVFSKCMNLHLNKLKGLETKTVKDPNLSIMDAIELKLSLGTPVSKEHLFYYLYGRELEDKMDLNRISKLINKFKSSRECEIESVRGAYQLTKKAS